MKADPKTEAAVMNVVKQCWLLTTCAYQDAA